MFLLPDGVTMSHVVMQTLANAWNEVCFHLQEPISQITRAVFFITRQQEESEYCMMFI